MKKSLNSLLAVSVLITATSCEPAPTAIVGQPQTQPYYLVVPPQQAAPTPIPVPIATATPVPQPYCGYGCYPYQPPQTAPLVISCNDNQIKYSFASLPASGWTNGVAGVINSGDVAVFGTNPRGYEVNQNSIYGVQTGATWTFDFSGKWFRGEHGAAFFGPGKTWGMFDLSTMVTPIPPAMTPGCYIGVDQTNKNPAIVMYTIFKR